MLEDQLPNTVQFICLESIVCAESYGFKPKLTSHSLTTYMNMFGFAAIEAVKEKQVVQVKRMKEDVKEQQKRDRVHSLWVTRPLFSPRDAARRKKIVDSWMKTDARKRTKRAEEDAKLDEKHTKKVEKVARKWIAGNIWGRSPWDKLY